MILSKKNIYTHNYTDDEILEILNNSKVSMYKKYSRNGHLFYLVDLLLSENKIKSFEWFLKNNINLNKIIKNTLNVEGTFLDKYLDFLTNKYQDVKEINNKIINILNLIKTYQDVKINYNFLVRVYNINKAEINKNNEYIFYKIYEFIAMDDKNLIFLADMRNKEFIKKMLSFINIKINPKSFFKQINKTIYNNNLDNNELKQRIFYLTLILDVKKISLKDLYAKNKKVVINQSIENHNSYCFYKVIKLIDNKYHYKLLLKCINHNFEPGIRYFIKELNKSNNLDFNIIDKINNEKLKDKIIFILKHKLQKNLTNHVLEKQKTTKNLNKL